MVWVSAARLLRPDKGSPSPRLGVGYPRGAPDPCTSEACPLAHNTPASAVALAGAGREHNSPKNDLARAPNIISNACRAQSRARVANALNRPAGFAVLAGQRGAMGMPGRFRRPFPPGSGAPVHMLVHRRMRMICSCVAAPLSGLATSAIAICAELDLLSFGGTGIPRWSMASFNGSGNAMTFGPRRPGDGVGAHRRRAGVDPTQLPFGVELCIDSGDLRGRGMGGAVPAVA